MAQGHEETTTEEKLAHASTTHVGCVVVKRERVVHVEFPVSCLFGLVWTGRLDRERVACVRVLDFSLDFHMVAELGL